MAFPILGTPIPQFFDSNGVPLVSGTITVTDPDTSAVKAVYPTLADADAETNSITTDITLNSRGEPPNQLWGRDGEDYKLVIKDSSGSTIHTWTDIVLPSGSSLLKVKTADETLTTDTLADDTHLVNFLLDANAYYSIEGFLLATADAASRDLKIDFVVDNTVQDSAYAYLTADAATAGTIDEAEVQAITSAVTIDIDGTSDVGITVNGFVFTHATSATNLDLQVAQGTDAGTTTLKKGSWLKFEKMST